MTGGHTGTLVYLSRYSLRGSDSDCFPSGPTLHANIPKPLPRVPVSASSQEDKLPPLPPLLQLPDPNENYVIPIEDSPAAEYMNQDGKSGLGCRHRRLGEQVAPCDISLLSAQCLLSVSQCPRGPRSRRNSQQNHQSHQLCPSQVGLHPAHFPSPLVTGDLEPHPSPSADLRAITSFWATKAGGSSPQAPLLVTSKETETLGAWLHGGQVLGTELSPGYPS